MAGQLLLWPPWHTTYDIQFPKLVSLNPIDEIYTTYTANNFGDNFGYGRGTDQSDEGSERRNDNGEAHV